MADAASEPVVSAEEPTPQPPKPNYRHDWYQTASDVRLNIMIKGLKKEQVTTTCEEREVSRQSSLCSSF